MSKGEQTRQRILEQAAPLFNKRGYDGCSIQDVMKATGLEKGGIYRHFSSKEELAVAAFDLAWKTTTARRRQDLGIPDHVDRLEQHVQNFVSRSGFPGGCPLLNTAVGSDNGNPVLRNRVRTALRGWLSLIRSTLKEGIEAGTVRPEVDPHRIATILISGLEGGMLLSRIEKSDLPLHTALEHLDSLLETEVRAKPPRSRSARRSWQGTHLLPS